MAKFINLDFNNTIPWKFLKRHLLYSSIWIIGVLLIVFRLDFTFRSVFVPDFEWLLTAVPLLFISIVVLIMFKSKWYYNLTLLIYPLLIIFWFFPKFILDKGKIYLFSNYLGYIFKVIKNFKKSILKFLIFSLTILFLIISNSDTVRIISMIIMTFFYYKFLITYVSSSFQPAQLFGISVEKAIDEYIASPEKQFSLVKNIEASNEKDDKLTDEQKTIKKMKSFVLINFFIESFRNNLKGFNGKKAFIISWLYQLFGFLIISIFFFTFLNFELFVINKDNFKIIGEPNLFDFFYYTIKTITYNNTLEIIPLSPISKIIETFTFLTLGIFILVLVTSVIFSLRQDRIEENIKKATDLCVYQNQAITEHIRNKYQTDLETVTNETGAIKNSLEKIKKVVERFF